MLRGVSGNWWTAPQVGEVAASRPRGARRLDERSLTLHQGLVTLIGWPLGQAHDQPVPVLDEIRRACQLVSSAEDESPVHR